MENKDSLDVDSNRLMEIYQFPPFLRKLSFLFLVLLLSIRVFGQQDPQFSQNMFNELAINPGYAGHEFGFVDAYMLNRLQWVGFDGAPLTMVFGADYGMKILGKYDGVGLTLMNDEIGNYRNISVNLSYAYRINLGNGKLAIGISPGVYNRQLSADFEGEYDPDDPSIPTEDVNGIAFDMGLGLYYIHDKFRVGASVTHITEGTFDYNEDEQLTLKRHYYVSALYNWKLHNSFFELRPSIFFKTDGVSFQIDTNLMLYYKKKFWGGISYRLEDAVIMMLGANVFKGIKVGYSYDITTSSIAKFSSGTHEIMVSYAFQLGKRKNKRYVSVRYL